MASAFMNMTFLRSCMVSVITKRERSRRAASRATRWTGIDPHGLAAGRERRRRHGAHQPDVARAVDQAEARLGERGAEAGGGRGVGRVAAADASRRTRRPIAMGQVAWTGS